MKHWLRHLKITGWMYDFKVQVLAVAFCIEGLQVLSFSSHIFFLQNSCNQGMFFHSFFEVVVVRTTNRHLTALNDRNERSKCSRQCQRLKRSWRSWTGSRCVGFLQGRFWVWVWRFDASSVVFFFLVVCVCFWFQKKIDYLSDFCALRNASRMIDIRRTLETPTLWRSACIIEIEIVFFRITAAFFWVGQLQYRLMEI